MIIAFGAAGDDENQSESEGEVSSEDADADDSGRQPGSTERPGPSGRKRVRQDGGWGSRGKGATKDTAEEDMDEDEYDPSDDADVAGSDEDVEGEDGSMDEDDEMQEGPGAGAGPKGRSAKAKGGDLANPEISSKDQ